MINLNNVSLRRKAVLVILAGIITVLLLHTLINSTITRKKLEYDLNQRGTAHFNNIYSILDKQIRIMVSSGTSMADLGLYYKQNVKRFGHDDVIEMMEVLLRSRVGVLDSILGMGLWYEPGTIRRGRKYVGPYAYKVNRRVHLTWEYSNRNYDYFSRPWYRIAVPQSGSKMKKFYITAPYYDMLAGKREVFITFAMPMIDRNGVFTGVCTIDWGMESINKLLTGSEYTGNSMIMLIDMESNSVIYHTKSEMVMTDFSENSWYSELKSGIDVNSPGHKSSLNIGGENYEVFYRSTESGYLLVTAIPSDEAYSHMRFTILFFYLTAAVMALIIILYVRRLMNKYLIERIVVIDEGIRSITAGDYSINLHFKERDELTSIAESINLMGSTIQKREADLILLQENLAGIFRSIPMAIVALDHSGKITEWNRAMENFISIPFSDARGKKLWEMVPEFEKYKDLFTDAVTFRKTTLIVDEILTIRESKNFNLTSFPFSTENGMGCAFLFEDKTEVREKENQLRQAQKMENLGTLAGGLAHDFNNILAGIMGTSSLILFLLKKGEFVDTGRLREFVDIIYTSAGRAADIVKRLLLLTKKPTRVHALLDLNEVVKNIEDVCRNTFDKRIIIETEYSGVPALVMGDAGQLEQCILNICINSAHAMTIMRDKEEEKGGHLKISIIPSVQDSSSEQGSGSEIQEIFWEISISDSGVGMNSDMSEKIFEPFFTTKKQGLGTGLGLAMVHGIIKDHGGTIDVASTPGLGTVFKILLPFYDGEMQNVISSVSDKIKKGQGRILLVDDEKDVSRTMNWMLESCGYETVIAEEPESAREIYSRQSDSFDAVILDYMLGSTNSIELYKMIRKEKPDAVVIFSSGYWLDGDLDSYLQDRNTYFIPKPCNMSRLCSLLTEVIKSEV